MVRVPAAHMSCGSMVSSNVRADHPSDAAHPTVKPRLSLNGGAATKTAANSRSYPCPDVPSPRELRAQTGAYIFLTPNCLQLLCRPDSAATVLRAKAVPCGQK
eukprot:6971489-Prymnesium_polylepis.1